MKYYCTHFDINYTGHALSLYHSLVKHAGEFKLFMFCMDDDSCMHLGKQYLNNAVLIPYEQLENAIPNLIGAKFNRSRVEYFYTCSPATCYYVFQYFEEVDLLTYLDADLYFYSSPLPLFDELGNESIGIIEHRFHWFSRRNKIYGNFNVGWISFRKNENGLRCLNDWMQNCIKWCYQQLEDEKYADQKYLDAWPNEYHSVKILHNKGANLAIWNIGNYKLKISDQNVFVDNERLIFYHFANLKQISENKFCSDLSRVFVPTNQIILEEIYVPYIHSLLRYQVKVIIPKNDFYNNNIVFRIKKLSRDIRQLFFPDIINIV